MTRLRDIYGPGHSQADYLRALAASYETGWWDERGVPASWPEELREWPEDPITTDQSVTLEPGQPPFRPPPPKDQPIHHLQGLDLQVIRHE